MNAEVNSRYHCPSATPGGHRARSFSKPGNAISSTKASTLTAINAIVTTGTPDGCSRPPNCVTGCRMVLAPASTHSTHWWPTAATRMHSPQMYRSQRVQVTKVLRLGCRKQVGDSGVLGPLIAPLCATPATHPRADAKSHSHAPIRASLRLLAREAVHALRWVSWTQTGPHTGPHTGMSWSGTWLAWRTTIGTAWPPPSPTRA